MFVNYFVTVAAGSLTPVLVDENIVYFGESELPLQQDAAFSAGLAASLPQVQAVTEELRVAIARALAIDDRNFVVVLVVVEPDILAFEYQSGVYLNCGPLVGASRADMRASVFFSLLHELTHRAHANHDTAFAQEYGKLVFKCSKCLAL